MIKHVCSCCGGRFHETWSFETHTCDHRFCDPSWCDEAGAVDDDPGDGKRAKLIGAVIVTAGTAAMLHQEIADLARWIL